MTRVYNQFKVNTVFHISVGDYLEDPVMSENADRHIISLYSVCRLSQLESLIKDLPQ